MRKIFVTFFLFLISSSWCFSMEMLSDLFEPESSTACTNNSDCPQGYHCDSDRSCRKIEVFDLVVEKLEIPEVLEWGDEFNIVIQIRNNGDSKISSDFELEFYLSKDRTLNEGDDYADIHLGSYTHRSDVAPHSSAPSLNIIEELPHEKPSNFSEPGPFYVIAKADSSNDIDEIGGEENNLKNEQFMTPTVKLSIDRSQIRESPFGGLFGRLVTFKKSAVVSVILTKPRRNPVTVFYKTTESVGSSDFPVYSATSGDDYEHKESFVRFPSQTAHRGKELEKIIEIPIKYDAFPEPDEVFRVVIHDTLNAPINGSNETNITIKDNLSSNAGQIPKVSTASPNIDEGTIGVIPVFITPPSSQEIEVSYSASSVGGGTAEEGQDYESTSGTITIPSGVERGEIYVPTIDDNIQEQREYFYVRITKIKNAIMHETHGFPRVRCDIVDNDGP